MATYADIIVSIAKDAKTELEKRLVPWKVKRYAYILSLEGCTNPGSLDEKELWDVDRAANKKYKHLQEVGDIPVFCRLVENAHRLRCDTSRNSILGEIKDDPAYKLVCEIVKQVDEIAWKQISEDEGDNVVELVQDDEEMDIDDMVMQESNEFCVASKRNFFENLQNSFEKRQGKDKRIKGGAVCSAMINDPARYDYLLKLAELKGPAKQQAIEDFVREAPDYWDNFRWEHEYMTTLSEVEARFPAYDMSKFPWTRPDSYIPSSISDVPPTPDDFLQDDDLPF
jgi:hypothetical protein